MNYKIIDVKHQEKEKLYKLLQYSLYDIKNICQNIILHVTKENVPAYNLYKKLNFITTSEIIYYDNL